MEEKDRTEQDTAREEDLQGCCRPEKKRKNAKLPGLLALGLCLLALAIAFSYGLYTLVHFAGGALSAQIIHSAKIVLVLVGGLSLGAMLLAFFALFSSGRKKAAAIISLVLALLLLIFCAAAVYAYEYIFGAINEDKEFQNIEPTDLSVVQVKEDGEISRWTESLQSSVSQEEIEEQCQGKEVEYESLWDDDLPDEAKEVIYGSKAEAPSYLLEGYEDISTFVLYGTDENGSSDTIILLSVDRVHHKIKMISIARDSYVTIPQWGSHGKLTYAYSWGGPQMAVSTLNYNFFLNVTDYITVNMDQMEQIVDLVGGVEVDLDWAEATNLAKFGKVNYGKCRINGKQAVAYSRIRTISGSTNEITRTSRQREVLISLMNSVKDMPLIDYPAFIRNCLGMCTTSFDTRELMDIALEVVQNNYSIESYALLDEVNYWGGNLGQEEYFYCVYDLNKASDVIYRIIYEDLYVSGYPDEPETQNSEVQP